MTTLAEQLHPPVLEPGGYTKYKIILGILGAVVPLLVAVLYFFPQTFRIPGAQVRMLPAIMMATAFGLGSLFLLSYVAYHSQADSTHFGGVGAIRTLYFVLLLTHISLAVVTVALVLFTLYFALTGQYTKHRSIARWTFPVWLYVSVTGVIVYFMIAPYYPAA
jgi:putative membrane protein